MSERDILKYSLADFGYNDNPNVLSPPEDFMQWISDPRVATAFGFFEQPMQGAPRPRTVLRSNFDGEMRRVINLTSYNYLGLSTHPEVLQAAKDAIDIYGIGASGAAMLSGTFDQHVAFADELAQLKHKEAAMLTSSGLGGNVGAMQALLQKGDVLIMDDKCHRSLVDGGKLSGARMVAFRHNDPQALNEALEQHTGKRVLVVVEGVYSMDGDEANLPAIVEVCEQHGAPIYLDEAHSTLIYGPKGGGLAEHHGLSDKIGVCFGTLSKSFGGVGGFVASSAPLVRYMKCYASPFQFSCALPPPMVAAMRKSLEVATRDSSLRDRMWQNVAHFRKNLEALNLDLGHSTSQIIPIIVGADGAKLIMMAMEAQRRGLFLQPIDYPAVEAHARRFRISVSAQLTPEDIDEACNIIEDVVARPMGTIG